MQRLLTLIVAPLALAACSTEMAGPVQRTSKQEAMMRRELAGKVPGKPVSCLPSYRAGDMTIVDDNTILFRDGRRTYVQSPRGGCAPLGSGNYTLVTKSFGGSGLCRGDIARVVDLQGGGMTVGSCSFDDFVPYDRPRS